MKQLRLVVVGPGLIGKKHIDLILQHDECCLAALVAPDHAPHQELASRLQAPLYHDVESLLSSSIEVDGAIISSPNLFHAEQAMRFIEAGIPVLVEKPITHSYDAGAALVEFAEKKGVSVLVGHHRAHSPIMSAARTAIENGSLGRLVAITGSALFYKPDEYFRAGPWRTKVGGGPILINLIHEVGNFRSLCGEIVTVQALSSSNIRGYEVEDSVAIVFGFSNGALGTFILSDAAASASSWELTSGENPSYPCYREEDCYHVAGTLGSLSIPTMKLKCYPVGQQSWWRPFGEVTLDVTRRDPLACQLDHFLQVILGKAQPLVSGRDGLRNLRVTEAVVEAASRRSIVDV